MTTTSISELVERLQCSCMEVHGEDPDCIFHGEETEWAVANILPSDWQQRVMDLRAERDALEALTRSTPTDEGAVERALEALDNAAENRYLDRDDFITKIVSYGEAVQIMHDLRTALTASIPDAAPEGGPITAKQIGDAMQEAWDDICADTNCHPLDIRREGRKLYFHPSHWAEFTATSLNAALTTAAAEATVAPKVQSNPSQHTPENHHDR
jgi:hypothetical protein